MEEKNYEDEEKRILQEVGVEPKLENGDTFQFVSGLEEYLHKVWHAYVQIKYLEYSFQDKLQEIKSRCLNLLEIYAKQNENIGNLILKIKPSSKEHAFYLQEMAAQRFIISSQKLFEFLQESGVESDCLVEERDGIKSFTSTKSEYHKVLELVRKSESTYEDLAVYYLSKNDYSKAHLYYYLLGELIIQEIYYAEKINDDFLLGYYEKGYLYYNAGRAFLKCYKSLKDRYILTSFGPPSASFLHSNISEVFNLGNKGLLPEQLAIMCFEKSKPFLLKSGQKESYSKALDYLYELKSELNDFESNVLNLFIRISREFVNKTNIVVKKIRADSILEGDVRDFFLSCLKIVLNEIAVAESLKCNEGETDLILFGKDNFGNRLEAISEFKVWGRNYYKTTIQQLKSYLTSFENFGIIVMINPNKSSISKKYVEEIIKKDTLLVENSFEESSFGSTGFQYFKTKSYTDDIKIREIPIYHLILDIGNLFSPEYEEALTNSTTEVNNQNG